MSFILIFSAINRGNEYITFYRANLLIIVGMCESTTVEIVLLFPFLLYIRIGLGVIRKILLTFVA